MTIWGKTRWRYYHLGIVCTALRQEQHPWEAQPRPMKMIQVWLWSQRWSGNLPERFARQLRNTEKICFADTDEEEDEKDKPQQELTEAEKADEEVVVRLITHYGVTEEAARKALKDNKYDEDKAGAALEKQMDLDDDEDIMDM